MKFFQLLSIILLLLLLYSCGDNKLAIQDAETPGTVRKGKVYIKDASRYDSSFVVDIRNYNDTLAIIDNIIVTGVDQDTVYFPEDLPVNQDVVFIGKMDNQQYQLSIRRKNFTIIAYKFDLVDNTAKRVLLKEGYAVLNSMFFLAAEIDEDDKTQESYASSEYLQQNKDCWASIRISDKDASGMLRALITYGCDEGSSNSFLNCPTLRTK